MVAARSSTFNTASVGKHSVFHNYDALDFRIEFPLIGRIRKNSPNLPMHPWAFQYCKIDKNTNTRLKKINA